MPDYKGHKIKAYELEKGPYKGKFVGQWQKPGEKDWAYCVLFPPRNRRESALADCRYYLDTMDGGQLICGCRLKN